MIDSLPAPFLHHCPSSTDQRACATCFLLACPPLSIWSQCSSAALEADARNPTPGTCQLSAPLVALTLPPSSLAWLSFNEPPTGTIGQLNIFDRMGVSIRLFCKLL